MKIRKRWIGFALLFCLFQIAQASELKLSVDHFSRAITATDTALYLIEAFVEGNKAREVNFRALESFPTLDIRFSSLTATTPALICMRVYTLPPGFIDKYKLSIAASIEGTSITDTLQVWLHVVNATSSSPKLTFATSPNDTIKENAPGTLEGQIVPPKSGIVTVRLFSPSSIKDTLLTTAVDNITGLFHVNHVFTEHGTWEARAVWHAGTSIPDSSGSELISLEVQRRPPRLTVAADDSFRYKPIPTMLRVLGQLSPDYARGATIAIKVTDPDNQDTVKTVLPDTLNGKFSTAVLATKHGIYRIEATAILPGFILNSFGSLEEIHRALLYASVAPASILLPAPSPNCGPRVVTSVVTLTSAMPAGYAVIVVGYGPNYDAHLNLAYHFRDDLIHSRGFRPEDIWLGTLINNRRSSDRPITPYFTNQQLIEGISATLSTPAQKGIKEFLSTNITNSNFPLHRGLLFFWIGDTRSNDASFHAGNSDSTPLPSMPGNPMAEGSPLPTLYIKEIYNRVLSSPVNGIPLWKYYNEKGINFLHAGDNSGMLLNSLYLLGLPTIFNGGGVFWSTNSGTSWATTSSWPSNASVLSLASNGSTEIFAGTFANGVYRATATTSGGTTTWTWLPFNNIILSSNMTVLSLVSNGTDIFAGTIEGGVYRATTGTATPTWTSFGTALPGPVLALDINAVYIFAGTSNGGVFRSLTSSASWTDFNNTVLTNRMTVPSLAIGGGYIFAGTSNGGVFRSTLTGTSWTRISNGVEIDVSALAINTSGNIFAGTRLPKLHMVSSLAQASSGSANVSEDFSTLCGLTTFAYHFLSAINSNYTVRCAFKHGWQRKTQVPEIDSNIFNASLFDADLGEIDQSAFGIFPDELVLGYNLGSEAIRVVPSVSLTGSIKDRPQLGPEGIVWVILNNPGKLPVRGGTLVIDPPDTSSQPLQSFKLRPVDPPFLWKTQVDVYKHQGLYRGTVYVEYEMNGRREIATAFFERFRHDLTAVPCININN